MQQLNFRKYPLGLKNSENRWWIFDIIRKKFMVLQPEEWVRQHWLHYLIEDKGYPASLINVEKEIRVNGLKRRYDIVVFNSDGSIAVLVECKAPEITIDQKTFDQIARYNRSLGATYLVVSNGLQHYYCQMDQQAEKYVFLRDIPDFSR
jgi:hypothetical protein